MIPIYFRRGTDLQRQSTTLAMGEPGFTTDTKRVYAGDGTTPGGIYIGGGIGPTKHAILTPSTTATATPTLAEVQTYLRIAPTGGSAYTYTLVLDTTNRLAGSSVNLRVQVADAPITVQVRNASSGGTVLWSCVHVAGTDPAVCASFVFNGTAWERFFSGYENV